MVTTIVRETVTETVTPEKPIESATMRALERKSKAEEAYKTAEAGRVKPAPEAVFCCTYHKKAAVNAARKELKRWDDWLAMRATLQDEQLGMFSDEDEDDDEDDDEREMRYARSA